MNFELCTEPETDAELDAFLDWEWAAWHTSQNHDLSIVWSSSPVTIVARDERHEVVGALKGRIGAGIGHLSELMIAGSHRGSGIGTRLVRQFERHCWSIDCHKLTVHTELDGPAHIFYQKLGWRDEAIFRRDRGGRDFVRLYKYSDEHGSEY